MIANAALFLLGAVQHVGVVIGPLSEPTIIPAAIVETVCGLLLAWGGAAVIQDRAGAWGHAVIANLTAASGVALGVAALAAGRGPRTASNDLYHRIMLVLIAASLVLLFTRRSRAAH